MTLPANDSGQRKTQGLKSVPGNNIQDRQKGQGGGLVPDGVTDNAEGAQQVVIEFQGQLLGGRKEAQTQMQVDVEQEQDKQKPYYFDGWMIMALMRSAVKNSTDSTLTE